jgi:hypothetical protein
VTVYFGQAVGDQVPHVTGGGWVDLVTLTPTIVHASSNLFAAFTASGERDNASEYNALLRVTFEGAPQGEQAANGDSVFATPCNWSGGAFAFFAPALAGLRTVKLQWNGGNLHLKQGTHPDWQHAALYFEELPTIGTGLLASELPPRVATLAGDHVATGAYTVLLTTAVTTVLANSDLEIVATTALLNLAVGTCFTRLKVDGVVILGAAMSKSTGYAGTLPLIASVPVAAGLHTVAIEWFGDGGNLQCNAASQPELCSCSIRTQEKPL